jgi:hypothetical protein
MLSWCSTRNITDERIDFDTYGFAWTDFIFKKFVDPLIVDVDGLDLGNWEAGKHLPIVHLLVVLL